MPKSKPPRKKVRTPVPSTKQNTIMDDLMSIDRECRNMLAETARFSPYLTNRTLVQAGDVEQIHDNSKILARDTMQMCRELDAIRADIPKRIYPDRPSHVMRGLSIGDRYTEWREKYERAILPTLERLGTLFKDAAENLNAQTKETVADDNA